MPCTKFCHRPSFAADMTKKLFLDTVYYWYCDNNDHHRYCCCHYYYYYHYHYHHYHYYWPSHEKGLSERAPPLLVNTSHRRTEWSQDPLASVVWAAENERQLTGPSWPVSIWQRHITHHTIFTTILMCWFYLVQCKLKFSIAKYHLQY